MTTALRRLLLQSSSRLNKSTTVSKCNTAMKASCSFSTNTNTVTETETVDPSKFVHGVSTSHLENDTRYQEYFAANFPSEYGNTTDEDDEFDFEAMKAAGIEVPDEVYEDYNFKIAGVDAAAIDGTAADGTAATDDDDSGEVNVMAQQCDLSLNIRPLVTYTRDVETEEGSRQCRTLRENENMIPGILYGSDPTKNITSSSSSSNILIKTPWKFIQRELDRFTYHNFESRVYDLTLFENEDDKEGTIHRVMPRDVQFHPIYNKMYCCNYLRYYPGKPVNIPIVYINEEDSPAIKRGGFLAPFNKHILCVVDDGVPIPEGIELDFTDARLNQTMRLDRLVFPDGVRPSTKVKDDFLIGTVFGRKSDGGGVDSVDGAEAEEGEDK
jgi:large subunit ribosomal protein L25